MIPGIELAPPNCWRTVGVWGDRSCPHLKTHIHCHNCTVFASAGRNLLEREPAQEYRAEWTAMLAQEEMPQARHQVAPLSIGIFRLGEEWLALSSGLLSEVTDIHPIHGIPHRSHSILRGMVNIRGEIQLCVNLHNLLGIPPSPEALQKRHCLIHQRMVVIEKVPDRWVFVVDEMHGIYRLEVQLDGVPATVAKRTESFTQGVFHWQDRQVGLLDPELLFYTLSRRVL